MTANIMGSRFQMIERPQEVRFGQYEGMLEVHLGPHISARDDDGYVQSSADGPGIFIIGAKESINPYSEMGGLLCFLSGSRRLYRIAGGQFDGRSWCGYLSVEVHDLIDRLLG
jgi:hypothetical protein